MENLLYGLPKIHKPCPHPLRPVVSAIGGPTYNMSRFLSKQLAPLARSEYNVRNSNELVEFVTQLTLPEDHIVLSLDVISLFTKVPIDLALTEIDRRYTELQEHTTVGKNELVKLLVEFCLTSGYFQFEGRTYIQKYGIAMGSPISPVVADLVMNRAVDVILERSSLRIFFVRKYVDDLLLAVHRDDVPEILEQFNGFHHSIQFTMELEVDGKLPYLDVTLHRDETGSITTVWYSKPSSSQRMLNFYSKHPRNMILNVARNLMTRVRSLTTKPGVCPDTIIRGVLKKNSFPNGVIQNLLSGGGFTVPPRTRDPGGEGIKYHAITHIPGITERVKKEINNKVEGVRITLKPALPNRRLVTALKDRLPVEHKKDVVYDVPCGACPKRYIGTTSQLLKHRMQKHKSDCRLPIRNEHVTTLCHPTAQTGHQFKLSEATILDQHRDDTVRNILECFWIRKEFPLLVNKRTDFDSVSHVYAPLLDRANAP
ncbi:uncharacterized protein DMENIID0001_016080 [Sergentomyia squamirostris]